VVVTLHKHRWLLSRPGDGMELHEQIVWTFTPQPESEIVSDRLGILHRRSSSVPVEVEAPAFSRFDDAGRFWVQWHKLGREIGQGATEPDWLPAELVWSLAQKGARGFAMAKAKAAGPTLFDLDAEPEAPRANGAYGPAPVRSILPPAAGLEAAARPNFALGRMRQELRDEIAAEQPAAAAVPTEPPADLAERFRDLAETVLLAMRLIDARKFANAEAHLRTATERLGISGEQS
jgi:hypothetical protein